MTTLTQFTKSHFTLSRALQLEVMRELVTEAREMYPPGSAPIGRRISEQERVDIFDDVAARILARVLVHDHSNVLLISLIGRIQASTHSGFRCSYARPGRWRPRASKYAGAAGREYRR